jgi:hypothetical protein
MNGAPGLLYLQHLKGEMWGTRLCGGSGDAGILRLRLKDDGEKQATATVQRVE